MDRVWLLGVQLETIDRQQRKKGRLWRECKQECKTIHRETEDIYFQEEEIWYANYNQTMVQARSSNTQERISSSIKWIFSANVAQNCIIFSQSLSIKEDAPLIDNQGVSTIKGVRIWSFEMDEAGEKKKDKVDIWDDYWLKLDFKKKGHYPISWLVFTQSRWHARAMETSDQIQWENSKGRDKPV